MCLRAANGDITGAEIATNGWQLYLWIEGAATNGTFNLGWGTNNIITGSERCRLNLTTQGYYPNATLGVYEIEIYGGKRVRFASPYQAFPNTVVQDGDCRIIVSLSDFVYANDSNITATVAYGLYDDGTITNAAASAITVTNSSTLIYPKAIGNWTWPGFQLEQGSTMQLRAVGFSHPIPGMSPLQPLACMQFIAEDQSSHIVTNTVSRMNIEREFGDSLPFGEYITDIDITGMDNTELIRCDFVAYPWRGTNRLDTRDNLFSGVTAKPVAITNLYQTTTYSDFIAVVNPTAGGTPRVTNVVYSSVNSGNYFGTIAAALTQLAESNNAAYGHATAAGSTVYLRTGITSYVGGTFTAGATDAPVWTTIANYPGDTVTLTTRGTDRNIHNHVRFTGINTAWTTAQVPLDVVSYIWFDQCDSVNSISTAPIQNTSLPTVVWISRSTIGAFEQGLRSKGGQNVDFMLRGNMMDGFDDEIISSLIVGNLHIANAGTNYTITTDFTGMGVNPGYSIIYNNAFYGHNSSSSLLNHGIAIALTNGSAVIQNVFEKVGQYTSNPLGRMWSASTTLSSTNRLWWNDVFVGQRVADVDSSGSESTLIHRSLVSSIGIINDTFGLKGDIESESASAVGGWPTKWGVGNYGMFHLGVEFPSIANPYPPEWSGLFGYTKPVNETNTYTFAKYFSRLANPEPGNGGGNYRLRNTSPVWQLQGAVQMLPYDIEGYPVGRVSAPSGASRMQRVGLMF